MIALNHVVRRKEHASAEQFSDYWLGAHADQMISMASELGVQKYTKCETQHADEITGLLQGLYGTASDSYDFVDQLLINDLADFKRAMASEDVANRFKALYEESLEYIESSRSDFWITVDIPQLLPRQPVCSSTENTHLKGIYIGPHRDELTLQQAQLHWNACHGGMARQYSTILPYDQYIQAHRMPSQVVDDLKQFLGGDFQNNDAIIGHAEVWLDRRIAPTLQGPEIERMLALLVEDIGQFAKPEEGHIFAVKEHVLISRSLINDTLPRL
ncbi:MAG: EthD domain-containing protein, partial [Pseudomonadales bacterium]